MRKNIHCKIILAKFIKSKLKTSEFVLLLSAITQIIYLDIKPYGVVNDTVNVAKKVRVFSGFVNAILKKTANNIKDLTKVSVKLNDFPRWFVRELNKTDYINLNSFIDTYHKQPNLHLVFKSQHYLDNFNLQHTKTSKNSTFLNVRSKVNEIKNFNKGEWWVQVFINVAIGTM